VILLVFQYRLGSMIVWKYENKKIIEN